MPYSDSDKQKEFQKVWAKKRNAVRAPIETKHLINREDGSINLKRKVVTWEELNQGDIEKIKSWEECVGKAKGFIFGRRVNRIMVAGLAIRACTIKHGGDRRTEGFKIDDTNTKNLRQFAEQISIHHHTLCSWVKLKRELIDKLPERIQQIDMTSAMNGLKKLASFDGDATKAYEYFSKMEPMQKRALETTRYLNNAAAALTTYGLRGFSQEMLNEARVNLKHITKALK